MKRIGLLLLFCMLLSACHTLPQAPDFTEEDFAADIVFTLLGREYAAEYTKTGATKTLVLRAPDTVAGVTAQLLEDGRYTLTVGEVTFPAAAAERILTVTKLFAPPAGCLRFSSETDKERCFTGSDGADTYRMYTDLSGLVTRLSGCVDGQEYDIQILRMERRDRT